MNSYELSRSWFDYSFSNPDKIKPLHTAIYFFAIEHCNRLGWKEKFGFPSQMVMEAVGVKNWRTYSKALNDLVDYGFLKMIETSKNQYSSNIIAIVKNTKATTKALDKALQKHSTKQGQSTVSIDKQYNNITKNNIKEFDLFWSKYPNKVAKQKCKEKFLKLKEDEVKQILDTLDNFINYKPFESYNHPNPETYLNQKRWEDVITPKEKEKTKQEIYEEQLRAHLKTLNK